MNNKYNVNELQNLKDRLNLMNPVDIAEKFEELIPSEIAVRIKLLNKELLADTFSLLSSEKKRELINILSDDNIAELMKELDEDELVDTLQELPANMVKTFMHSYVDKDRRNIINTLLGYPEDSVGSIMSVNFLSVKDRLTSYEILDIVKQSSLDSNKLELIWITDEILKLKGFIYLADIVRNPDVIIEDIIRPITKSVTALDDQEVVAKLAFKYDLSDIPVVDSENRLIGTVPTEWAIDVMVEEHNEDMSNISGITDSDEEAYLQKSNFKIAKDRTTWLIICLITATLTGFIMRRYEHTLAVSVVLASYIPMLMDSGGNAGSQSSTTVIRSLYLGEIDYHSAFKIMLKELSIGIYVGIVLVAINFVRMMIMDSVSLSIGITVSVTLFITIIISKIIGGILPIIADKLKIDPTVMAGPIITTVVDTVALLVYFEIASILLSI